MDADVDMTGRGEVEITRASPTHGDTSQRRESTQHAISYENLPLPDLQHETAPAGSPTQTDSNDTEPTSASNMIHEGAMNEVSRPREVTLTINPAEHHLQTSRTSPSMAPSQQDKTIECSCPAGTVRFDIDFELTNVNGVPVYLHKPCMRPNPLNQTHPLGDAGKSDGTAAAAAAAASRTSAEQLAAKILGPDASAEQRLKVKHFTSTFYCDGPCRGSKKIDDYLVCKKCCAWQHKPCMLYGEEGDVGGPVCNRCFMIYLARRESPVQWQRKRLVQAVREAWKFFKDPANRHQVSRRAHARRFLAAFFLKNQASFVRFVAARKKADQLPTGRPRSVDDGDNEMDVEQDTEGTQVRRSMSVTNASPSAASGDGLDDLEELDRRIEANDDDITTQDTDVVPQDNGSTSRVSSVQDSMSVNNDNLALVNNSSTGTVSTPRKVDRAYVEAHKHERNFHHRGKKTFLEGLPALDANIKSAVYGPGAEQWRIDAKAYQQSSRSKAPSSKVDARATSSTKVPRPKPAPPRTKPVPSQQNLAGPALSGLKPAAARLKPVPSDQATDAPKRKRLPSPEESTSMTADPGVYRSSAPRKSAPGLAPRKSIQSPQYRKRFELDVSDGFETTTPVDNETTTTTPSLHDKVACRCKDTDKASKPDCFKCIECGTSQHKGCHDDNSDSHPAQCNFCLNATPATKRSIEAEVALTTPSNDPEAIAAATRLAKAARAVNINGVDEYIDSFREAVSQESLAMAKTTLWKSWCNAPYPGQAFTSPPVYPAEPPEDWLKEMRARVEALLFAAGRERSMYYLQPVLKQWPRNDLEVMQAIRDMTLEVLHRGARKMKRAELGVLAEVVGIEEKGWAWKGAAGPKME